MRPQPRSPVSTGALARATRPTPPSGSPERPIVRGDELAARSPADPTPAETAADALDLTFWNSVKDSNRRDELQAYLDQHPNGHFAGLARARLSSSDLS